MSDAVGAEHGAAPGNVCNVWCIRVSCACVKLDLLLNVGVFLSLLSVMAECKKCLTKEYVNASQKNTLVWYVHV